jgi:hypothetical protein
MNHQCNRCLAPLRVYQGQPVRVCDRCGAIQTGFAPPQVVAPRAAKAPPVLMILLVVTVLGVLAAGLVAAVVLRRGAIESAGPGGLPGVGVPGAPGTSGAPLWDNAQAVKDPITRQLGAGAKVTEVLLYRDYAFVQVQEGAQQARYELRDGAFKKSDFGVAMPRMPGERPDDAVLPLSDIDFRRVAAMVKEAQTRVGSRVDEHVHVRLARHLPFVADPLWSIYLGQGNAEFNLEGKLVGGRTAQGADLEKELVNYFADASPVRAALVRRFGAEVELVDFTVYSTYAIAEVRDPRQRDNVDRFTIRPSGISPGDPQRNARNGWDAAAYRLDKLDFALLPRLATDAKAKLRGEVTHIIIEKTKWRIYVSDARNSGYVSYHSDGRLDRVVD